MFQLDDLPSARARAATAGIREVFEVDLEEISEVHLHPADMHGAIVSIAGRPELEAFSLGGVRFTALP